MAWIIDILLVLILAAAILLGYKRGMVKMLLSLLAVLAAVGLAFMCSAPLADFAYDAFLEERVSTAVDNALKNQTTDTVVPAVEEFLNNSTISFVGGTLDFDVEETVGQLTESSVEQAANTLKYEVIKPSAVLLLQAICMLILFLAFWLVLSLAARAIASPFKLPVIKTADRILGAVLGLITGVFLCIALCGMLDLSLKVTSVGLLGVTQELREQTIVYQFFGNLLGAR